MMRTAGGALLAVGAVILAACGACSSSSANTAGGGDGGGGGTDSAVEAGPSASQACNDFAASLCARLEACTPFALTVAYGDVGTCTTRSALLCTTALGAGGTLVTPTQMEGCAQAVAAETCDESMDNAQPSACAVPGSLADGTACGSHAQCQSGYCKLSAGTLCGKCTPHAGAGAQCTVDPDCQATLVCNSGTCIAPAQSGAACSATQPCLRTLTCIGGKCATPLAAGTACSAATDCDASKGVYCNTQTKKCEQTQISAAGQPCGIVNASLAACSGGASCAGIKNGQGTCHPPAADGAPCGPDIYCVAPAVCTSTARCTVPNPGVCK
jgi:hypothetical protein